MANEMRHAGVGTELSQAEWESVTSHILNDGVAGDLIYWDGTKFVRLGIGSNGEVLGVVAGILDYISVPSPVSTIKRTAIDYTVLITDDIVYVDTSVGNRIITMPAVSAATKAVTIKKITTDANTMTIDPVGTDTIEGDAAGAATLGGGRASYTLAPDTGAAPDNWSII